MFDKHRKRRVIYNDDADQQYDSYKSHYKYDKHNYKYDILDEQDFIDSRTSPTFNTQVDTYVWCLGNGADPPWGSSYPFSINALTLDFLSVCPRRSLTIRRPMGELLSRKQFS